MDRPGARVAIVIASLAAVVWLVVGLVVLTDSGGGGSADTLAPVTTPSTSPVSATPVSTTTAVATSVPVGSAVSTTAATSTTVPAPLVIDLAVPAPAMTPQVLASFPIVDPSDPRRGYAVTTDHHKRIVVLDLISGDVSFADVATGAWTTYPSDVPGAKWAGYLVVGPDDVIYMQLVDANSVPGGVAFALHDGRYVEVGRYPSGVGDADVVAASTGPALIGDPTHPLTPYLGPDGAQSGATLSDHDFTQVEIAATHVVLSRGPRTWDVEIAHTGCDGMCNSLGLGPGDDALVFSQLGNGPSNRLTWLSDKLRSWDTDWHVAGPVDSGVVVVHTSSDQLEIGLAK